MSAKLTDNKWKKQRMYAVDENVSNVFDNTLFAFSCNKLVFQCNCQNHVTHMQHTCNTCATQMQHMWHGTDCSAVHCQSQQSCFLFLNSSYARKCWTQCSPLTCKSYLYDQKKPFNSIHSSCWSHFPQMHRGWLTKIIGQIINEKALQYSV